MYVLERNLHELRLAYSSTVCGDTMASYLGSSPEKWGEELYIYKSGLTISDRKLGFKTIVINCRGVGMTF